MDAIAEAPPDVAVIVDLDETLFLLNTTEEYLDSARPRVLAAMLLGAVGLVRPWKLWPERARAHARDWFRVVIVTALMPWTVALWRRKLDQLGTEWRNRELCDALDRTQARPVIVATNGFGFIVEPLVERIPCRVDQLVAARFRRGIADRAGGKVQRLRTTVGDDELARSVAVTDSETDRDLVDAVSQGFLVKWPSARYRKAQRSAYVPFVYLDQVKHPGGRFFLKTVLADDWVLAVLAVAWGPAGGWSSAATLLLLYLSFWCVYEAGYMENDRVAATLEAEPFLHAEFHDYSASVRWWSPWAWALGFLALAVLVEERFGTLGSVVDPLEVGGWWLALLIGVRATFWIFNHVDKQTRVWIYPGLQAFRSLGITLVAALTTVGVFALVSQAVSRWAVYVVYRVGGGAFPRPSVTQLMRLMLFALMVGAAALGQGWITVSGWQLAAISGWFVLRARRGLIDVFQSARLLRENDPA